MQAEYHARYGDPVLGAGAALPQGVAAPSVAARTAVLAPQLRVQSFDITDEAESRRFAAAMKKSHPYLDDNRQSSPYPTQAMLEIDAGYVARARREGGFRPAMDNSLADQDYVRWAKTQGFIKPPTWGDIASAVGKGLWGVVKGAGKTAWLAGSARHDPKAAATLAASAVEGAQGAVSGYKQLGAGAAALIAKFGADDNVRFAAEYDYAMFAKAEQAKQGEWRRAISPALAEIEVDEDVVGFMEEVLDPTNAIGAAPAKLALKGVSKAGLDGLAKFGAKEIYFPKLGRVAVRTPLVGQVDELSRDYERAQGVVIALETGVKKMGETLAANPAAHGAADALAKELADAEAVLAKAQRESAAVNHQLTRLREEMLTQTIERAGPGVAARMGGAMARGVGGALENLGERLARSGDAVASDAAGRGDLLTAIGGDLRVLGELGSQGRATLPLASRLRQAGEATAFTRKTAAFLDDSHLAWAGGKALAFGGAGLRETLQSGTQGYIASGGDVMAAAESVGSSAGFALGGAAWGGFTSYRDPRFTPEELEANRNYFRYTLSKREVEGGSQLQRFVRLDEADQLAIATYAQAHPEVAFTFIDQQGGPSGHYDRESNTVVLNKASSTPLRDIFRHEIGHFIVRHGLEAQMRDLYLGNAETGRPGEYTRLDAEGRPVVVESVDAYGQLVRRYALNDAGLALKRQYERQLRPDDPTFEIADDYFASELFAEQYADRLFSGGFRRDLRRTPIDSLVDALAPRSLLKGFITSIGLGFDRSDQVVGTGLFRGQRRNPHIEALSAEWNRASARGDRPAMDAAPADQRFTPEDFKNPELVAKWLHSGRAVKIDAEGRPLYDPSGAPRRPTAAETQAAQRELANALLRELETHAAAEPDAPGFQRSEVPTADGPQPVYAGRTIPAGVIDALAAQERFNPHQLAHLRALAATVEQHGSGALVSHFYQTEAPAGSTPADDRTVSGRWQRHGVTGFAISPDGEVAVHAVSWEQLHRAAKTSAATDPARLAYATLGGDIAAAITADARTYLDNAAAGRPAGEGLSPARGDFIQSFLGLPAHPTPDTGGLAALSATTQPFLATLSLDRMNRVTPLDPVDARSGLQHDVDGGPLEGDLQFRPDFGKHLRGLAGPPPAGMFDPHAHHIIFKAGREGAQKALVAEGHALLGRYGIDPIWGEENLTWAPMRVDDQHSTETLRKAVDKLKKVEAKGGTYEDIVRALKLLGRQAAQRE